MWWKGGGLPSFNSNDLFFQEKVAPSQNIDMQKFCSVWALFKPILFVRVLVENSCFLSFYTFHLLTTDFTKFVNLAAEVLKMTTNKLSTRPAVPSCHSMNQIFQAVIFQPVLIETCSLFVLLSFNVLNLFYRRRLIVMDELDYIVCLMPMMFSDTVGSTGSSYDDSLSLKGACYMQFRTGWYTG